MSHASANPSRNQHRHQHRRKVWPWGVGILGLLVLMAVALGVVGFQVLSESKQVQTHESKALEIISVVTSDSSTSYEDLTAKVSQLQQETRAAKAVAHGASWSIASKLPFIGSDIKTVQSMTDIVDNIATLSLPKYVDAMKLLQGANLRQENGINLEPVEKVTPSVVEANDALQEQINAYESLTQPKIGRIRSAYTLGEEKLSTFADHVDAITGTIQMLPEFLCSDRSCTYAVLGMTTSEMRSSGGLIGSIGELNTNNGSVSVGDFVSNGRYLKYGSGDHSADMHRLFADQGPLNMSFDIRDLAIFPDTADTAKAVQSIWQRTPWGQNRPLAGVILLDPVFVQSLVALDGNVTLDDGTVLTGENTAEFLLNTAYVKYSPDETDEMFATVASRVLSGMFGNMDFGRLLKLGDVMGTMAKKRHFTMYAFDENLEKSIMEAGFTGTTPSSEASPSVGIYLTEQNPSKLDWYIKREAKVQLITCGDQKTYHVEYSMHNTMTDEEAQTLPAYIAASKPNSGKAMEKVLFYAPAGGEISNIVQIGGAANTVKQVGIDGKKPYMAYAEINPGQTVTYSFDVQVSENALKTLTIDQTPMGWADDGITYLTPRCSLKE